VIYYHLRNWLHFWLVETPIYHWWHLSLPWEQKVEIGHWPILSITYFWWLRMLSRNLVSLLVLCGNLTHWTSWSPLLSLFWQPENEFKNVEILKNKTRLRVLHLTNRPEGTARRIIMVLPCRIQSPYSVHIARYLSCLVNGDGCHLPPSRCTCCPLIFAWRPHCLHGSSGCVQKRLRGWRVQGSHSWVEVSNAASTNQGDLLQTQEHARNSLQAYMVVWW